MFKSLDSIASVVGIFMYLTISKVNQVLRSRKGLGKISTTTLLYIACAVVIVRRVSLLVGAILPTWTHQFYFVAWSSEDVPGTFFALGVVVGVVGTSDLTVTCSDIVTASRCKKERQKREYHWKLWDQFSPGLGIVFSADNNCHCLLEVVLKGMK